MPIIEGSVSGPKVQDVRRYRECVCVCVPMFQYVLLYRECLWTYGSVCPSLQGVFVDLRFSMSVLTRNVHGLTVQHVHRYRERYW